MNLAHPPGQGRARQHLVLAAAAAVFGALALVAVVASGPEVQAPRLVAPRSEHAPEPSRRTATRLRLVAPGDVAPADAADAADADAPSAAPREPLRSEALRDSSPSAPFTVAGRLAEAATGRTPGGPVAGGALSIELRQPRKRAKLERSGHSDSRGRFELAFSARPLPGSELRLRAEAEGLVQVGLETRAPVGLPRTDLGTIHMQRAAILEGRLLGDGGATQAAWTVRVQGEGPDRGAGARSARVAVGGTFRIEGLVPSKTHVWAELSGKAPRKTRVMNVTLLPGEQAWVELTIQPERPSGNRRARRARRK